MFQGTARSDYTRDEQCQLRETMQAAIERNVTGRSYKLFQVF
jgi:hypothetical protein